MTQPPPPTNLPNPTTPKMRSQLSPTLLTTLFTSLTRPTTKWTLHRTLKSDNPLDINGDLHGTATFTPLPTSKPNTNPSTNAQNPPSPTKDLLYHEEGEMPAPPGLRANLGVGVGLRFTKKYIWRLSEAGTISVWFAKVGGGEDEPDYLFHEFEFREEGQSQGEGDKEGETFVDAPMPPLVDGEDTVVFRARGNHLCINDMYRTAYAFRVRGEDGEVVSWASRHVVKGPKKDQDIVNFYRVG
ncbi:hypothetical protein BDV27DRAFT_121780 [Aspergillus caelatus]|uniref:DUF6314 domain-containing protein n=1 Tax=Aspergillus caelatus TaxID=61420 RepID=A0A5N7AGS9_9EURO|nr:uncharacterized protein BDV27DRAFT_121780 [Aspergillus caelatus]KAE8368863.1 hypothetical protein BDV27DRAFT_121780 [Aspergillus caelatus]